MLDAELTLLTKQQDALKVASSLTESDSGAAAEQITRRKKVSRSMNATAAEIERLAGGLERLNERRHQSFGVRMFKVDSALSLTTPAYFKNFFLEGSSF
jgi:hypothetical protein